MKNVKPQVQENIIEFTSYPHKIYYEWDLENDEMNWVGPTQLLSNKTITANCFLKSLPSEILWRRFERLQDSYKNRNHFQLEYTFMTSDYGNVVIREEGVIQELSHRLFLRGSICIQNQEGHENFIASPSGYNRLTHLIEGEGLYENLESYLEQTSLSKSPSWAFFALSLTHVTKACLQSGPECVSYAIKKMAIELRQHVRFDDFIGHLGSLSFGVIIKECDTLGISALTERLSTLAHKVLDRSAPELSLAMGGVLFPGEFQNASEVISAAERNAMEVFAQRIIFPQAWNLEGSSSDPLIRRRTDIDLFSG